MTTDRADLSIVLALAVGLAAVLPAVWLIVRQPDPVAPAAAVVAIEVAAPETITEVIADQPIVVDGLDPSITAVLQAAGFLGRQPGTDELDPAVAAVLAEHGVVLRIAQEPAAP
ncbi:MAG: hypothetical protein OEO77_14625 [Acidimicrobiia bacterium]|nr:hypothetical protein [Acidimicrobiia bacterium]